jgi:hypothetical protein
MTIPERGMALPLAMFALVVMSTAIGAAFVVALLEQRLGRNVLYTVQAASAAEAGVAAVLGSWDDTGVIALAPGATTALPVGSLPGPAAYSPAVTRLNGELFLVRSEGTRLDANGGVLARREVAVVVRLADSAATPPGVRLLSDRPWVTIPMAP